MKTELLSTNQRENATLTMSSREIARITESRHRDVCLSIRNLMNKGVIGGYAESPYTHEQNGQVYYEYHINKRDTYVIVAQFSPEFTARLVDRWQELENQQKLPSNYLQALKALVESEEEKQTLLLENQTMKPKADFVDHYVEVGTSKSLRETAKILNFPEKMMIECLLRDRVLYRQSGNLLPYQTVHSKELFTVKTGTAEHGHNFTQTRVTGKGIEWIAQRYASELGL
ncbi:phage regulatory protein/antirepressor Ant [Glaesserella parasuis]|uniref:phage antirepressor KilAC domain-containing protein n=4 Tax=Glaesserella parasuis TaxID=738 RepID=UPI0013665AA4|nr:phage regulatory protein/antirepressor Ant [Glaesserella parasuis]MCT8655746.1 phage antirepressor KilAC domain-containing protein [Glaesserella parasuis]MCT8705213.1 phage antirepressor KilAC domain-containing protein [Glaesserella parasuis]MCT8707297.1 phage antirepressor KilAC domain-containing protein [Glaesserella parasuis]MCT8709449.1 phage antirepressor KilAC domain-containing protein [Glaesserella parasuis]MCT8713623.1 phage antirepressor KilAC domain-containing protein [Glaesserell